MHVCTYVGRYVWMHSMYVAMYLGMHACMYVRR